MTYTTAEVAACLWEACLEPFGNAATHIEQYRGTHGAVDTREKILSMVDPVRDWCNQHEDALSDEPFDWETCPTIINAAWAYEDSAEHGPRNIREVLAEITAEKWPNLAPVVEEY